MKVIKSLLICSVALLFVVDTSQAQLTPDTEFFFPEVADGQVDEDDEFRTIFVLNHPNVTAATATVTLTIRGQDGTAVTAAELMFRCLEVSGPCRSIGELVGPSVLVGFAIVPGGVVQLMTDRVDEATTFVGYAEVTSDVPISGMAIFGEYESELFEVEIDSQAAVEATGKMTKFAVADFRKNQLEGKLPSGVKFEFESESATGVAIVNLSGAAITLTLTEYDASGMMVDTATKALAPGEHSAFFFSEVLNVPEDFVVGTVVIETDGAEVTAVALKFDYEADGDERRIGFTVAPVIQLG